MRFVTESGQFRMAINKTQGKPPAADLPASLGQKEQVPSSVPRLAGVPPGGLSDPLQWFCVRVGGVRRVRRWVRRSTGRRTNGRGSAVK